MEAVSGMLDRREKRTYMCLMTVGPSNFDMTEPSRSSRSPVPSVLLKLLCRGITTGKFQCCDMKKDKKTHRPYPFCGIRKLKLITRRDRILAEVCSRARILGEFDPTSTRMIDAGSWNTHQREASIIEP